MDLKTIKAACLAIRPERSVLLKGESGIGKSAFVRDELTREMGLEDFIDVRLGQVTEGDVRGLPKLTEEGTVDILPEWFLRACKKPCMLFFDELNRAMPTVLQAVFQIVLDRQLSGHKLHPKTRVFAAINVGKKYDVTAMDPALLRRFYQFDFAPTPEEWLARAESFGVPKAVVTFLAANVGHLETHEPLPDDRIGPSRRGWTEVGQDLAPLLEQEDYSLVHPICYAKVGEEAAIAFQKFLKTQKKELSHLDILKARKGTDLKELLGEADHETLIRLADSCTKHMCAEKFTDAQLRNFADFVDLLPDELVHAVWKGCTSSSEVTKLGSALEKTLRRVL